MIVELIAVWASVILGLALHWLMPVSALAAVPIGLLLWIGGLAYTLHLSQEISRRRESRAVLRLKRPRGYPMVEARAAMHLGVAIGFRSWLTLIVAAIAIILNLGLAISFRNKMQRRLERRRMRL